ncbi:acyl-homoserine-lactone synthase [Roseateles sp. BYS180W]|uniref:Acyl-homoserine-lactone synthase n=1 Tax=Roseateles rivi TaxID=3299028 RepID=A0ABW7FU07_9BURK
MGAERFEALARYRYEVFVQRLGWPLQCPVGRELDQYDRDDVLYVLGEDEHGRIVGAARLLPSTRPYMLQEVFAHLLGEAGAPCSAAVWELSRFAAEGFDMAQRGAAAFALSPLTMTLLKAAMRTVAPRGAQQLLTVSPLGIGRLLRRSGLQVQQLGPAARIGTELFGGFAITLPQTFPVPVLAELAGMPVRELAHG